MSLGFVRPARAADADEIARIQLATWQQAYSKIVPRHVMAVLEPQAMAGRWHATITALPSARHHVLVAVEQAEEEHLVGFAAVGPADDAARAPQESPFSGSTPIGAITDLLVEPRWGRRGHGSRLLSAAVAHWRDDGFTSALAWAFADDAATRKFLTSAGWEPDGASRALDMDDILVDQLRLHTALTP